MRTQAPRLPRCWHRVTTTRGATSTPIRDTGNMYRIGSAIGYQYMITVSSHGSRTPSRPDVLPRTAYRSHPRGCRYKVRVCYWQSLPLHSVRSTRVSSTEAPRAPVSTPHMCLARTAPPVHDRRIMYFSSATQTSRTRTPVPLPSGTSPAPVHNTTTMYRTSPRTFRYMLQGVLVRPLSIKPPQYKIPGSHYCPLRGGTTVNDT